MKQEGKQKDVGKRCVGMTAAASMLASAAKVTGAGGQELSRLPCGHQGGHRHAPGTDIQVNKPPRLRASLARTGGRPGPPSQSSCEGRRGACPGLAPGLPAALAPAWGRGPSPPLRKTGRGGLARGGPFAEAVRPDGRSHRFRQVV